MLASADILRYPKILGCFVERRVALGKLEGKKYSKPFGALCPWDKSGFSVNNMQCSIHNLQEK